MLTEDLRLVPGNRVLLRSPNNPWTVACWLGVLKAGGIAVTTFASLRARELGPVVEKARPVVALTDHRFTGDVEALTGTVAPELAVVPFGGDSDADLIARAAAKSGVFRTVETAADDVALFCPTSGSTGEPKITMHFHRDLLSIDNTFGKHTLRLTPEDVTACTAPLAFTFGLGMLVVFPLRAGACALLTRRSPRRDWPTSSPSAASPCWPPRPRVQADHRRRPAGQARRAPRGGLRGRAHPDADLAEGPRRHRAEDHRRHRRDRDAAHLHRAAGEDIRPGATGRPVPGYRATILDADGDEAGPGVEGGSA